MGRKIRDRQDALACLNALSRSGVDLSQWCHEHGVDGRSLNCWRRNLGRTGRNPDLVELVSMASDARYVVRVDGIEVEVGDDFHEATLARLLGVLTAC